MEIELLENGPAIVKDSEGTPVLALCRCGNTEKEDGTCDGSHKRVNFESQSHKHTITLVKDSKCDCSNGCC
jgi:CDGSH-type Zn-finger protein